VDPRRELVGNPLHPGGERRPLVRRQFVLEERDGDCRRRPTQVIRDGDGDGAEARRHFTMFRGVATLADLVKM
jgi:hypothetical protein